MSEKTEKPTPKRLREAQQKGQVAKSRTAGSVAGLAAGVIALTATAGSSAAGLFVYTRRVFDSVGHPAPAPQALQDAAAALRHATAPVLFAAMAATAIVCAAQVGFSFRPQAIAPSFEKINPIAGAKRMWSPKTLVELLKATVALVGVLAVAYAGLKASVRALALTPGIEALAALRVGVNCSFGVARRALMVGIAMAALDYAMQRRTFMKDLMMSKEDVKQEHKDSEGDPHVKGKRKRLAREILAGTAKRGVKNATTVVVNPTHIAVCVRYDADECDAPTITDKAVGERALRMRLQAEKLRIPVVRDIPLARTLVHLDVGDEIPEELYEAVAVVLKTAMELQTSQPSPPRRA